MASLDWIFLAVLAVSLVLGVWRGLVYEVLSVLGWIAAFVAAQWLAPGVAAWLPMGQAADSLRYAAGFVLVFIVVAFLGGLSAWAVKSLVEAAGMRPVDRTLGGAFGLVRGVVLLLAAAVVMNMTALNGSAWWMESRGAGVLSAALKGLKPVLPAEFGQYLPG
ncbi:MAG: CvpA family protein [Burkholderiaceae bacterium]|nr:CvpA family protein [Burkholderiaceae bacterium]